MYLLIWLHSIFSQIDSVCSLMGCKIRCFLVSFASYSLLLFLCFFIKLLSQILLQPMWTTLFTRNFYLRWHWLSRAVILSAISPQLSYCFFLVSLSGEKVFSSTCFSAYLHYECCSLFNLLSVEWLYYQTLWCSFGGDYSSSFSSQYTSSSQLTLLMKPSALVSYLFSFTLRQVNTCDCSGDRTLSCFSYEANIRLQCSIFSFIFSISSALRRCSTKKSLYLAVSCSLKYLQSAISLNFSPATSSLNSLPQWMRYSVSSISVSLLMQSHMDCSATHRFFSISLIYSPNISISILQSMISPLLVLISFITRFSNLTLLSIQSDSFLVRKLLLTLTSSYSLVSLLIISVNSLQMLLLQNSLRQRVRLLTSSFLFLYGFANNLSYSILMLFLRSSVLHFNKLAIISLMELHMMVDLSYPIKLVITLLRLYFLACSSNAFYNSLQVCSLKFYTPISLNLVANILIYSTKLFLSMVSLATSCSNSAFLRNRLHCFRTLLCNKTISLAISTTPHSLSLLNWLFYSGFISFLVAICPKKVQDSCPKMLSFCSKTCCRDYSWMIALSLRQNSPSQSYLSMWQCQQLQA